EASATDAAATGDVAITASSPAQQSRVVNKASFVLSILNRKTHDNRVFRTGGELCPGDRGSESRTGDLARCGNLELLRCRLAQLKMEPDSGGIPEEECNAEDADWAAESGYLEIVRE